MTKRTIQPVSPAFTPKQGPADEGAAVYQLKVTLDHITPPIWRRLLVPAGITLGALHTVLQTAMGWEDSHLYEFRVGKRSIGSSDDVFPTFDLDADSRGSEEEKDRIRLCEVAPKTKSKLTYSYDFGDDWRHTIVVEKILPPDPKVKLPSCVAGERACPPEDCGGPWGYAEMLEAAADPEHPDHEERVAWLGEDFDPEAFDPKKVDKALRRRGR